MGINKKKKNKIKFTLTRTITRRKRIYCRKRIANIINWIVIKKIRFYRRLIKDKWKINIRN